MAVVEGSILLTAGKLVGESLIAYAISKCADLGWDEVSRRVGDAMERGRLPLNSVFERALLRSALLATRLSMDEDAVTSMASPMHGGDAQPQWVGGLFARGTPAVRAYRWLDGEEARLRHDARNENLRHETIRRLMAGVEDSVAAGRDFAIGEIAGLPGTESEAGAVYALCLHMVNMTITEGGWKDAAHAHRQLMASCNKGERWNYALTHFYAQEIKADQALRALLNTIQLEVLGSEQRELRADVMTALGEVVPVLSKGLQNIETRLEEIERVVTRGMDSLDVRRMFQDPRDRAMSDDRFHFSMEYDDFIGREADIETIASQLFDPDGLNEKPFLWMAVCGEGGTGKSRLCQRIIEKALDWDFANAGFANAAFLADPAKLAVVTNQLHQNTLIVVDYSTNSVAHLPRFLGDLARYAAAAGTSGPAIRLIMILRNSNDPFFKLLENLPANEEGRAIQRAERLPMGTRLTLKDLSDADTSELMRRRMSRLASDNGKPLVEMDGPALLERLARFDRFKRPLFALMVAESLQSGDLEQIARDRSVEEARFALFERYLARQRREYWRPSLLTQAKDAAEHDLERHENTVRLATGLMGVELSDYDALRDQVDPDMQELLPKLQRIPRTDSLHLSVIRTMTGVDVSRAGAPPRIAPLEPDIIGEYFFLAGDDLATENGAALSPEQVVRLAYLHDPDKTLHFLRMATQDYPRFMAENNFLLPGLDS